MLFLNAMLIVVVEKDWIFIKMNKIQSKLEFLKEVGCQNVRHQDRTLLEHLIGTSEKLKKLGAPQYLQDAGLFHSIYGTASFMPNRGVVKLEERDKIQELIGEQSEEIVYWFCIMNTPRLEQIQKFTGQLKTDLLLLHTANQTDISENNMMTWDEAYEL